MKDEAGHFALEAVVGLAIASLILLAAQWAQSSAVDRLARSRVLWGEVLKLQDALGCVPRLDLGGAARKSTSPGCESYVPSFGSDPGDPTGTVRIEIEGRPLTILTLRLRP